MVGLFFRRISGQVFFSLKQVIYLPMSVDVDSWSLRLQGLRRVITLLAIVSVFEAPLRTLPIGYGHIRQKITIEGYFLPALCPPQIVLQPGNPFQVWDIIHMLVNPQHFEHFVETGLNFSLVDFDELAELDVVVGRIGIDFDRVDDRVEHIQN